MSGPLDLPTETRWLAWTPSQTLSEPDFWYGAGGRELEMSARSVAVVGPVQAPVREASPPVYDPAHSPALEMAPTGSLWRGHVPQGPPLSTSLFGAVL